MQKIFLYIFCIIGGSSFLQKTVPFIHTENVQKLYKIYTESIQKLYRKYFCMFSVYFLDSLFFIRDAPRDVNGPNRSRSVPKQFNNLPIPEKCDHLPPISDLP